MMIGQKIGITNTGLSMCVLLLKAISIGSHSKIEVWISIQLL